MPEDRKIGNPTMRPKVNRVAQSWGPGRSLITKRPPQENVSPNNGASGLATNMIYLWRRVFTQ